MDPGGGPAGDATLASDADRERAVAVLRRGCEDGRLTVEELTERVERAYSARTIHQLEGALAGLPRPVAPPPAPEGVLAGPYSGGQVAAVVLLTVFVPLGLFVALAVALSLRHGERSPARRTQLRWLLWSIAALFAANGLLTYVLLVR